MNASSSTLDFRIDVYIIKMFYNALNTLMSLCSKVQILCENDKNTKLMISVSIAFTACVTKLKADIKHYKIQLG